LLRYIRKNSNLNENNNNLSEIIDKIKSGDNELRDKFIEDYKPFILSCASKAMKKYLEVENSEEFSIAMIAFNEAINYFDKSRKSHFLSFSELVIKRRLINYRKVESKNSNIYPFSYFGENEDNNLESSMTEECIKLNFTQFEAREEIIVFTQRLGEFGITLNDLIKKSPKHNDSKKMMIEIARIIAENDYLYEKLIRKMRIPMPELISHIKVNKRTVERNKKYIIAACIVLRSDLDIIKEFLKD